MDKEQFKEKIKSNIERYGYHVTFVIGDITPCYSYTIGLTEKYNFELVFAGGIFYKRAEIEEIITQITYKIIESEGRNLDTIQVGYLGSFSFSPVEHSWSKLLLLGIYDIYKMEHATVYQIIPDENHFTLDIPDMSNTFSIDSAPIWQWMIKDWDYSVPGNSDVGTDIYFLMGEPLTEITRWEENYWEMYHLVGTEIPREQMRIIPLATVLAIDPSILPALDLSINGGLVRENLDDEWSTWEGNVI